MFNYIKGIVEVITKDYVVLENQNIGYQVQVSHPEDYIKGVETKVFIYTHVREDDISLFGFLLKEEKDLFLRLIDVTGIGPKTAINILSASTYSKIVTAIETSNTAFLKKLPGIGPKTSQQIILDLKGKLILLDKEEKLYINQALEDAKEALKQLGFKNAEIDRVLAQIPHQAHTSEEYLKIALTLMKKG